MGDKEKPILLPIRCKKNFLPKGKALNAMSSLINLEKCLWA